MVTARPRGLGSYLLRFGRWLKAHPALFFLLWALWLAFEYFGFGPYSYVRIHDNGDSFLPARIIQGRALAQGAMGYWNSIWVSGADNFAAGVAYEIDSLLFTVMPGWLAYGLVMWTQRFLAGYFTFRLLRDCLTIRNVPALYAALAYSIFAEDYPTFAWAGFTLYHGLAIPGIPFVLWALSRLDHAPRRRAYVYAAGLGVLLAITTAFQYAIFLLPAALFWLWFFSPMARSKMWVVFGLFSIGWLLAELPVIWASVLNAPLSHRADFVQGNPIQEIIRSRRLLEEHAVSVVLLLAGLFAARGRDRNLLCSIGAVILLFGSAVSYSFLSNYLGFLSGFNFQRISNMLFPFLILVGAAAGLDSIVREWFPPLSKHKLYRFKIADGTLVFVLAVAVIGANVKQSLGIKFETITRMSSGANFATLYQNADLLKLAETKTVENPFRVATIPVHWRHPYMGFGVGWWLVPPVHPWSHGLETADGYMGLYPERYQEFWALVIAGLEKVDGPRWEQFSRWGNQVYLLPPVGGFAARGQLRFDTYFDLKMLSLANVRYIVSPLSIEDEDLTLLHSEFRDEQREWHEQPLQDRFASVLRGRDPGRPLYIYENKNVLPRVFLANDVRVFEHSSQVLRALQLASYEDLQSIAYLTQADARALPLGNLGIKGGKVTIETYTADKIVVRVDTDAGGILVVTNSYSPFWKSRIGGVEAAVFPVDHAFQGVYVNAGRHEVVLEYSPPYALRLGDDWW